MFYAALTGRFLVMLDRLTVARGVVRCRIVGGTSRVSRRLILPTVTWENAVGRIDVGAALLTAKRLRRIRRR